MIGSSLNADDRRKIFKFLKKNINVFAWQPYNMPGIDAEFTCHKFHIDPNFKPIKQKPRRPEKV